MKAVPIYFVTKINIEQKHPVANMAHEVRYTLQFRSHVTADV
jgi:hypothetical protein